MRLNGGDFFSVGVMVSANADGCWFLIVGKGAHVECLGYLFWDLLMWICSISYCFSKCLLWEGLNIDFDFYFR